MKEVGRGWILLPGNSKVHVSPLALLAGTGAWQVLQSRCEIISMGKGAVGGELAWGRWSNGLWAPTPEAIREWEVIASWDTASSCTAFLACLHLYFSVMPLSQPPSDCSLRNSPRRAQPGVSPTIPQG